MVQAILTLYSWRSRAACDITAGKAAALVGRYARIQTRIQRCGFLALAAQAQHMDSSDRAHSIPRPAFGGAMLTLRWGRAAPPAPAVARRSVPPAAKSGLLGRLHFWSAGVAPSGVEHHAQRTRLRIWGSGVRISSGAPVSCIFHVIHTAFTRLWASGPTRAAERDIADSPRWPPPASSAGPDT